MRSRKIICDNCVSLFKERGVKSERCGGEEGGRGKNKIKVSYLLLSIKKEFLCIYNNN